MGEAVPIMRGSEDVNDKHEWTEDDDIVALYLYRFGPDDLPISVGEIGDRLGMGAGSLRMRIGNFRAIDGQGGLDNAAIQSRKVYESHAKTSKDELRAKFLLILEGPGQANDGLRKLGFTVEPIQQCEPQHFGEFVVSIGNDPPDADEERSGWPWFHLWQRRLWPYADLNVGDVLYWYDPALQAVRWKTRVADVYRFEYTNKEEVLLRLREHLGLDSGNDSYLSDKPGRGFCLAYKVTSVEPMNVPKPNDFSFPRGGWLRFDDPKARAWLLQLCCDGVDGGYTDDLQRMATTVKVEGYFEPQTLNDERERRLREIVQRRGQPEFRTKLIDAFGGCCAITGCDALSALEAAHIVPYCGPQSNHPSNGLLLRADIHTLFDLDLIAIHPASLEVTLAEQLLDTSYQEIEGKPVSVADEPTLRPNSEALKWRWERFQAKRK
jgi:5-methylcytosine-specific restriction protein A